MRLERGTVLHGDELEMFNRKLNRNYTRAEVVWVDTDDKNSQAQVRVVDGRGHDDLITVPAVLEETVEEEEVEGEEETNDDQH